MMCPIGASIYVASPVKANNGIYQALLSLLMHVPYDLDQADQDLSDLLSYINTHSFPRSIYSVFSVSGGTLGEDEDWHRPGPVEPPD